MTRRPPCAECGSRVSGRAVRLCVLADKNVAIVLCQRCQSRYPRDRQYAPTTIPPTSRVPIRGGAQR